MTVRHQLLCFFHSLGGDSLRRNALATGYSKAALMVNSQICIKILSENFTNRMIKWPTVDEMNMEADLFVNAYGGPKTVFLLADGTFVRGLIYLWFDFQSTRLM